MSSYYLDNYVPLRVNTLLIEEFKSDKNLFYVYLTCLILASFKDRTVFYRDRELLSEAGTLIYDFDFYNFEVLKTIDLEKEINKLEEIGLINRFNIDGVEMIRIPDYLIKSKFDGFIKIHRIIVLNPFLFGHSTTLYVWIYIIYLSSIQKPVMYVNNRIINVKKGQFLVSSLKIGLMTKVENSKIRHIFERFSRLNMILKEPIGSNNNLITIINYPKSDGINSLESRKLIEQFLLNSHYFEERLNAISKPNSYSELSVNLHSQDATQDHIQASIQVSTQGATQVVTQGATQDKELVELLKNRTNTKKNYGYPKKEGKHYGPKEFDSTLPKRKLGDPIQSFE